MTCSPSVEKNKQILKDLWTLNKEKYKNFDNVAKFILDAPITQENKAVSLSIISQIFVALSQKNPNIEIGKALEVARNEKMISFENGISKYLFFVKSKLDYRYNVVSSFEQLIDQIEIITSAGVEDYTQEDYEQYLLKPISAYFYGNTFATEKERNELIDDIKNRLAAVEKISTTPAMTKRLFKDFFESLNVVTSYVNLKDEAGDDQYINSTLLTLSTNEMVEGILNNDGTYYDVHTGLPIDETTIVTSKKALYQRDSENAEDRISQVFYENDLASGLRYKPFMTTQTNDDIVKSFDDVLNSDSDIKIYAVKLNDFTDKRIDSIKEIKGLENKNYETFESKSQSEYLKSKPDGSVMTMLRETKRDDVFTLVAEITTTNNETNKFYIYGLNNYGILNADNTVTRLDFTNDSHLDLVQEHSIFKQKKQSLDLDNFKLLKLKELAKRFNGFKESILSKVESAPNISVDVTEEFYKHYKIEKNFITRNIETLEEARVTSPNAFFEITTVIYNDDGSKSDSIVKQIPFAFVKRKNDSLSYMPVNFLSKNEVIVHEGKEYQKISDYLDAIGIDEDFVIDNVLKGKSYNSVFLTMNQNGQYGYRTGKYAEAISNDILYSKFLADIVTILEAPDKKAIFNNRFNQDRYSFRLKDSKNFGPVLNADLDLGFEGDLQIQFTPYSRNKLRYESLVSSTKKGFFRFPLGQNTMTDLLMKFVPSPVEYSALQGRYAFLNDIVLFDPKGKVIYSAVPLLINALYKNSLVGNDPQVEKIISNLKQSTQDFNKVLDEKVINLIKTEPDYKQFLAFINEDFGSIENVLYNTYENGLRVPFINFGAKSRESVQETLDTTFDNYFLVNSNRNNISITTRDNAGISSTVTAPTVNAVAAEVRAELPTAIVATPEEAEEYIPGPKTAGGITFTEAPNLEDDNDVPFAVLSEEDALTASLHDIDIENKWFAKTYGEEFAVENLEMLHDFIKLTKLEGTVLGAVKDRVIYLDNLLRNKEKGVLYHEAFHAVFRYTMNNAQRNELLREIINNKKYASRFSVEQMSKFVDDRNINFEEDKVRELIAEEILAEGFQNYMNKKMAPKTILQKFFEFLKNLLNFFRNHNDHIDYAYNKIRTGKMTSDVVNSEIYNSEIAFLSVPGLIKSEIDSATEKVKQIKTVLSSKEQNQLIDSVVKAIIDNRSKYPSLTVEDKQFDEAFNEATTDLLNNTWNLDKIIASVKGKDEADINLKIKKINEKYGDTFRNYSFMLGGRMKGMVIPELNGTGSAAFDNQFYKNSYSSGKNEPLKDNSLGEVSYELLKGLVKEKYKTLTNLIEYDEDIERDDAIELQSLKNGFESGISNPEDDFADEQDERGENFDDRSLSEKGGLESLPKEIREILSIIGYQKFDKELGVNVPRFVDGYEMYGVLLKISSGVDYRNVIENIRVYAEKLRDDIVYDAEAEDMMQIYNYIKEVCGITVTDNNEIQSKNTQFYNIFVDTIVKASVDYIVIDAQTKVFKSEDEERNTDEDSEMTNFTLRDKILA